MTAILPSSFRNKFAGVANSSSSTRIGESMAAHTESFLRPITFSPAHVLSMRNSLKMFRVAAKCVATQMINFHPWRNRTNKEFIAKLMRANDSLRERCRSVFEFWVFGSSASASPQPASCVWFNTNFALKTLRQSVHRICQHNQPHGIGDGAVGSICLEKARVTLSVT